MDKPNVVEVFADNGGHSHWKLQNSETGEILWEEKDSSDEFIVIEGTSFRRGDIYDIFEIERDKRMFFNREAGFIVQVIGMHGELPVQYRFGEPIPYESYPREIHERHDKWKIRMEEAIDLWKPKK